MTKGDIGLICCSAAQHFAKYFAKKANLDVMLINKNKFPGNELSISIDEPKHRRIVVIQSLVDANNDLMELLLTLEFLKSLDAEIALIIPYLAYARQDKADKWTISHGNAIANILNSYGLKKIAICDIHNSSTLSYFANSANLTFMDLFAECIASLCSDLDNMLVVSPDYASATRAKELAVKLGIKHVWLQKVRNGSEVSIVDSCEWSEIFDNKDIILLDDILATGSTIKRAAVFLKNAGVKSISVCVTHLFHPALQLYNLLEIDKLIYTNTIFEKSLNIKNSHMLDISDELYKFICKM